MTPDPARAPGRLAHSLVLLAVRALPGRAARERHRQELLAQLYGLAPARQLREAASVLVHCLALRAAVAPGTEREEVSAMSTPVRTPLRCHLHHKLRTATTPEGVTYRTCVRCGQDHYDGGGDNIVGNVAGNLAGLPGW